MSNFRQTIVSFGGLAAGTPQIILDGGEWFYIDYNDEPPVLVALDQAQPFPVFNRQMIRAPWQNQVSLTTLSTTAVVSGRLVYGKGAPPALNDLIEQVSGYKDLPDIVIAAGASAQILGNNGRAYYADVCVLTGGGGGVRLGTSSAAAARGFFLPPGIPWRISGNQTYAFNPNGTGVTVTVSTGLVS